MFCTCITSIFSSPGKYNSPKSQTIPLNPTKNLMNLKAKCLWKHRLRCFSHFLFSFQSCWFMSKFSKSIAQGLWHQCSVSRWGRNRENTSTWWYNEPFSRFLLVSWAGHRQCSWNFTTLQLAFPKTLWILRHVFPLLNAVSIKLNERCSVTDKGCWLIFPRSLQGKGHYIIIPMF